MHDVRAVLPRFPMTMNDRLALALGDRYHVEQEIGSGGMAVVFRARDTKHDRPVAIKVMRDEIAASLGRERFLSEIAIAARLQHPHILALIDSGDAHGTLYYVTPFLEGETLAQRIERERTLPVSDALRITEEIVSALRYAHDRGVLHRDIKPSNVMLTGGHAVVMDFGIARAIDNASTRLTSTGTLIGTPAYMAPEYIDGTADTRSDIYAVGCVLYEMLTGSPPFDAPTAQGILLRHVTMEPKPVTETRGDVPRQLEAVVMQALAKDPAGRFAGMGAFYRELQRAQSGAQSPRDTAAPATGRFPASGAHDTYLRGLHSYNKRNERSNDRAIDLLEQATSIDPHFAPAFAALAQAYIEKFFRYDANEEWEELAFVAIEKARILDPGLAAAYIAKGNLLWTRQRRFPHADVLEQYRRALTIEPDNTEALNEIGKVLFHIGHLDEAAHSLTRALEIDSSLASARFRLSLTEMLRGNYARSLELQRLLPGISYGSSITALRALNHHYLGRTDEGRRLLEHATADDRRESDFNSIHAIFNALSGRNAEAEQDIAREIEISEGLGHYHHAVCYIAAARALMGQQDAAIDGIARAAEDGFPCYPWFERDPCLESVRHLPPFVALLADLRQRWGGDFPDSRNG